MYLEERLVGRRRRRNLNRVELLLEFRAMVVNVRYLDDDPRGRRQRRPTVVFHSHLKIRDQQLQHGTIYYITRYVGTANES